MTRTLLLNVVSVAVLVAAIIVCAVVVAAPGKAIPGCYYSYRGCYLVPGYYDGRYWGGGPWWGWRDYGPHSPVIGCPVPYETGVCD